MEFVLDLFDHVLIYNYKVNMVISMLIMFALWMLSGFLIHCISHIIRKIWRMYRLYRRRYS